MQEALQVEGAQAPLNQRAAARYTEDCVQSVPAAPRPAARPDTHAQ